MTILILLLQSAISARKKVTSPTNVLIKIEKITTRMHSRTKKNGRSDIASSVASKEDIQRIPPVRASSANPASLPQLTTKTNTDTTVDFASSIYKV
jgi:hypothetical protein